MKQLLNIKVFQHRNKVIDKSGTPFRLYVIFRDGESTHRAFNNINWISEITNNDNIYKNYFEALPDKRLDLIASNTF